MALRSEFSEILKEFLVDEKDQKNDFLKSNCTDVFDDVLYFSDMITRISQKKVAKISPESEYLKQSAETFFTGISESGCTENLSNVTLENTLQSPQDASLKFADLPERIQNVLLQMCVFCPQLQGPNISKALIKKEFRRAAFKLHPDTAKDTEEQKIVEKFSELKSLYDIAIKEWDEWESSCELVSQQVA